MGVRVAINGFGRIGRLVCRSGIAFDDIEYVAVNDLVPADALAYLLKYDSTHGRYAGEITANEAGIVVDGEPIRCLSERDPANLPWKDMKIDYVVESTASSRTGPAPANTSTPAPNA